MTSNIEGLVREGVTALKAGRKEEARKLLTRATELDQRNEEAWLWLSATVDTLESQQICLENVIAINPKNSRALRGLEAIKRQMAKQPPPPASPAPPSDLPPSSAPASPFGEAAAPPGGYVPAFHGSGQQVDLPSPDEYDAWVDGLNLGGSPAAEPQRELGGSDPFGFESGPFQGEAISSDPFTVVLEDEDEVAPPYSDMASPGYEAPAGDSFDPFALPQASVFDASYDESSSDAAFADGEDPFGDIDAGEAGFSSASPFGDFESVGEYQDANELISFLDYIPAGIEATHLPGQGPLYPRPLLIGLAAVSAGLVLSLVVMGILVFSRFAL